jgi:hypothetical protein
MMMMMISMAMVRDYVSELRPPTGNHGGMISTGKTPDSSSFRSELEPIIIIIIIILKLNSNKYGVMQ